MTQSDHSKVDAALPAASIDKPATAAGGPTREAFDHMQQMAELRIASDGNHYFFNGYRYDRLPDAIAYAELMKSRPLQVDAGGPNRRNAHVMPPDDADVALMARLGITYSKGVYFLGEFRYDHLADALDYANRMQGRVDAPPA
jgi:hypothetical protein